jgi:hypothetical protein
MILRRGGNTADGVAVQREAGVQRVAIVSSFSTTSSRAMGASVRPRHRVTDPAGSYCLLASCPSLTAPLPEPS